MSSRLPVRWPAPNVSGFIAQLVEHRTGNGEDTGSNPVEVLNFFQASLRNCINCVHCDDHFFILKTIIIVHFTLVETTFRQTSIQNQSVLKISWPLDRDKITFKAIKNYRYSLRKTVSKRLIGYFVDFHGEEFMLTLQFGNVINFSNHISRFYCGKGSRKRTSLRPMIIRTCNGYRARLWWTLCNHDIDNKNNYY